MVGEVRGRIQAVVSGVEGEGMMGDTRHFSTGATRDTDEGKLEYNGFNCPLVEQRFAEYMHVHRRQSDGKLRDSFNWKRGIPVEAYKQSLHRHFIDLWLHLDGYGDAAEEGDIENVLAALRFNVNGLLHEKLKERRQQEQLASAEYDEVADPRQLPLPLTDEAQTSESDSCSCHQCQAGYRNPERWSPPLR